MLRQAPDLLADLLRSQDQRGSSLRPQRVTTQVSRLAIRLAILQRDGGRIAAE